MKSSWDSLKNRREFLQFMGSTTTLLTLPPLLGTLSCTSVPLRAAPFSPLQANLKDDLLLADSLSYKVLIKYNERINKSEFFGTHNDFLAFTPFLGKKDEGVMLVNHEYFHPVLLHEQTMDRPRTREDVIREQLAVGCSLIHIKKVDEQWTFVADSAYNRRLTGRTPIPFQKGYSILNSKGAIGTLANCAGGKTPWGTVLTCEENYDIFCGEVSFINKQRQFIETNKYRWFDFFPFPPEHYGWVVEINPMTGKAIKRNALGRFEHECATVKMGRRDRAVVYMGEDKKFGFIYKFIADKAHSLESGTLYVANTEQGRWIPLDLKKNPLLRKHFDRQIDVLTYTHLAAKVGGGTPQDRPEDIEIDPLTGDVFVSLTNNMDRNNPYGALLKIVEKNNDCESLEFTASTWMSGGPQSGVACPDNMVFDKNGNLWLTTDMPEEETNSGPYKGMGNNSLFYVPLRGEFAGQAYRVASAPVDAEFTGPLFSEDGKTLFLCVQHPGGNTTDPSSPTSTWPDRKGLAKSAVVTIQGPLLDKLLNSPI